MLKTIFKTIGVTLLIAYLAIAGFVWDIGQPPRVYRQYSVVICDSTDTQFIDVRDIEQLLRADSLNPRGKRVDAYSASRLQKALLRNPLIARADCYPTPDSTLRIDIYQRHPMLRIKSSVLDRDYYVDTEGRLMAYKPSRKAISVPLATGHITREMATTDLVRLVGYLDDHRHWRNAFTQIHVEPNGDVRLVPRKGDHTVLLGPVADLDSKFDRLRTFQEKVLDRKGWNAYQTLNLKFKGQVIAEKK